MPGPFLPVFSLSRSQSVVIGSAQTGTTGFGALNIPTNATATAASGGQLTAGTYYYKVTAINGRGGETKPCAEFSGTTSGGNLTLNLAWTAVPGAAGYNIYGRATGAEVFLTGVNTNSFADTGALTVGTATPPASDTSGLGGRQVPQLTLNPSTQTVLPYPFLVDLNDGLSRRDLAHHIAVGDVVPATPFRLTSAAAANSAAIAATPTQVGLLAIPAYALTVGGNLRVTLQGVTSTTGNVTVTARVGAAGTTSDTSLVTQTVAGATGGGGAEWNVLTTVQAVGSGTSGKLMPNAQFTGHGAAPSLTNNTAQVSVDTTIPEYLSVYASVSAGTVTVTNCVIEYLSQPF